MNPNFSLEHKPEKKITQNENAERGYSTYNDEQLSTFISFFLANMGGYEMSTGELKEKLKETLIENYNFPEDAAIVIDGKDLRVRMPSGSFFQKPLLNRQLDQAA